MSKVLIDRELLERVQERLDPHRDAVLWGAVCDTFRSATSGTPAMPVKAYYHEWTDLEGVRTRSVGLEVRKEFTDAPLVLESDAMARIACLEGEIAKRDARIVELESQYQRDVYGLNNEGDPIGGDPAGGYANDNARLRSELAALKAQEPVQVDYVAVMRADGDGGLEVEWLLEGGTAEMMNGMYLCCVGGGTLLFEGGSGQLYAAPVSEAKAQGVVLDGSQLAGLLEQARLNDDEAKPHGSGATYWNNAVIACQVAIRDALAAPVQQVSVPGGWRVERGYSPSGYVLHSPSGRMVRVCDSGGGGIETAFALFLKAMLAAAPAAPAADTGMVEALEKLARLGNGDKYGNSDGNLIAQAALAANRAQQVSVPDVSAMARILADRNADACNVNREDNWAIHGQDYIDDVTAMLAATPAADTGMVDMYRHLQKVTPYRFKKIQDASITDGGDVMYFHKDRFDAALLADMATHCAAKGVL